jgi:hypothetical protein
MTLDQQFHQDVVDSIAEMRRHGYNASYFHQMVQSQGAVRAAKILVGTGDFQSGLITLWEHKRLDLSMENRMLNPAYASLFTEEERKAARKRLADLHFVPDW